MRLPTMQAISIFLLLISVGLVVGPVSAVVIMYRDDLAGLVIPPEIKDAMNGNPSFILNDNVNSINGGDNSANSILNNFVAPTFVDANVNPASKTFSVRVNVVNCFNYDLTLNTLRAEVQTPDGQQLATVSVSHPLTVPSGQSAIVTVDGTWTQAGETYILGHSQDSTITIGLAKIAVDVNGIKVERSDPFTVTVPLSLSGVNITG
jgi:hypothetical protein